MTASAAARRHGGGATMSAPPTHDLDAAAASPPATAPARARSGSWRPRWRSAVGSPSLSTPATTNSAPRPTSRATRASATRTHRRVRRLALRLLHSSHGPDAHAEPGRRPRGEAAVEHAPRSRRDAALQAVGHRPRVVGGVAVHDDGAARARSARARRPRLPVGVARQMHRAGDVPLGERGRGARVGDDHVGCARTAPTPRRAHHRRRWRAPPRRPSTRVGGANAAKRDARAGATALASRGRARRRRRPAQRANHRRACMVKR